MTWVRGRRKYERRGGREKGDPSQPGGTRVRSGGWVESFGGEGSESQDMKERREVGERVVSEEG